MNVGLIVEVDATVPRSRYAGAATSAGTLVLGLRCSWCPGLAPMRGCWGCLRCRRPLPRQRDLSPSDNRTSRQQPGLLNASLLGRTRRHIESFQGEVI